MAVTFWGGNDTLAVKEQLPNEATPVGTIQKNVASSIEAIKEQFQTVKKTVNLNQTYEQVRNQALQDDQNLINSAN